MHNNARKHLLFQKIVYRIDNGLYWFIMAFKCKNTYFYRIRKKNEFIYKILSVHFYKNNNYQYII